MSRKLFGRLVLLITFVFLVGCSTPTEQVVPTPFPTAGIAEGATIEGPLTLTLAEVASSLGLYENATIIVTGRLKRQPLLVCDSEPQPSPATWALTENGTVLLASEFDNQVRTLLPEDLTMTVEGRLRRWNGPVGCGKQAQQQEIWYLETSRILSPRILTQATLTPAGSEVVVEEVGEVVIVEVTPVATADDLALTPAPVADTATPEDVSLPTPSVQVTDITPESTPTEDNAIDGTPTPTSTISAAATIPGTPTTTPTAGTPVASPTPGTPAPAQVVDMGDVYDVEEDFPAATLGTGEVHSWTIELAEDEVYDIKVIAPVPADVVLSLYRDDQAIIANQNNAPAGAPEILSIVNQPEGIYQIRVQTDQLRSADYIMLLSVPDDYELELLGFLAPGAPRSNVSIPEFSVHYWNFTAAAGNTITITLTPDSDADGYLSLFGPGGVALMDADDGLAGEAEVIEYTAETAGLYTIAVEEAFGEGMVYSIVIAVEP